MLELEPPPLPPPEDDPLSRELEPLLPLLLEDELLLAPELELLEDGALSCELEPLLLEDDALSCELDPPLDMRAANAGLPEVSSTATSAEVVQRNEAFLIPASIKQRSWRLSFGLVANRAFIFDPLSVDRRLPGRQWAAHSTVSPRPRRRDPGGPRLTTNLQDRQRPQKSMDMRSCTAPDCPWPGIIGRRAVQSGRCARADRLTSARLREVTVGTLFARAFKGDGTPATHEQFLSTSTRGAQGQAALTAMPDGTVIAVWQDGGKVNARLLRPPSH
ncbi:MAG TPA: hypothetical protein VHG32_14875 [Thermoanaerobaculia bacterium]|nr:hypothetical protein [Thermoanaerobaculia bacterium]